MVRVGRFERTDTLDALYSGGRTSFSNLKAAVLGRPFVGVPKYLIQGEALGTQEAPLGAPTKESEQSEQGTRH